MRNLIDLEFSTLAFVLRRCELVSCIFTMMITYDESSRILLKLGYFVRPSNIMIVIFPHSEDVYVLPRVAYLGILAL